MAGAVVSGAQVSYISQDCEEIPEFLGRKYGHMAKRLDLSFNLLRMGYEEDGAKLLSDDQQKNKKQLSQLQQGDFQPPQGRLSGRGA